MEPYQDIAIRLAALRIIYEGEAHGSARRFAKRIGLSESQWSNFEAGRRRPGLDMAIRLKKRCPGITLDWIYFGIVEGMPLNVIDQLQNADPIAAQSN